VVQWWSETKATLTADAQLWARLLEQEGVILGRIDSGIEDIGAGRRNYQLYASFGGTEEEVQNFLTSPMSLSGDPGDVPPKLLDIVHLLVNEVSQMHLRLKAMRDGALWRVVETAQAIHTELRRDDEVSATPWQAIAAEVGGHRRAGAAAAGG